MKERSISELIVKSLPKHPQDVVTFVSKSEKISRQGVHKHLQTLIREGVVSVSGPKTRPSYSLSKFSKKGKAFRLQLRVSAALQEDVVWQEHISPQLKGISKNIATILQYGFTEMLNNVIDHSESKSVSLYLQVDKTVSIVIQDRGVGAFKKIKNTFRLSSLEEAILHLSKGKLTTSPGRHSGEGIFFTSRAFDNFAIEANGLKFTRFHAGDDWQIEKLKAKTIGTTVRLSISKKCSRTLKDVFTQFTAGEENDFSKTTMVVRLAKLSKELFMSRSQAKRVLFNLEKFREIVLDFEGVESVGQGFVDEIFRVFQHRYPHITLTPRSMNDDVRFMVERSLPPR